MILIYRDLSGNRKAGYPPVEDPGAGAVGFSLEGISKRN
jgi:hypothetical protein